MAACGEEDADVTGTWHPVEIPGTAVPAGFDLASATVTFRSDGTWESSPGCGTDEGTFEIEGSDLSIAEESVDAGCGQFEVPYQTIFRSVAEVERPDDGTLRLLDADGDLLIALSSSD